MKKLIPAIVLLLISAIVMSTASYAWFSMNTQVTATGMQVKAVAEGGLVISDSTTTAWAATANAHVAAATAIVPTSHGIVASTDDGWYHNSSKDADNAIDYASATYTDLTLNYSETIGGVPSGIGYVEGGTGTGADAGYSASQDTAYHLKNRFYIKTSAEQMSNTNLVINSVTVTSDGSLIKLDAALRVAIVVGGNTYIFAPVASANGQAPTYTYNVNGNSTATVAYAPAETTAGGSGSGAYLAGKDLVCTGVTEIPAYTASSGVAVDIYIYYEGEDLACKSTNIHGVTVDALNVEVKFGTAPITTP